MIQLFTLLNLRNNNFVIVEYGENYMLPLFPTVALAEKFKHNFPGVDPEAQIIRIFDTMQPKFDDNRTIKFGLIYDMDGSKQSWINLQWDDELPEEIIVKDSIQDDLDKLLN